MLLYSIRVVGNSTSANYTSIYLINIVFLENLKGSWRLLDAAQTIIRIAGSGSVLCNPPDPVFPSRGSLCCDAAHLDFGFTPIWDFKQGVENYHNWIINSPYWGKLLKQG